MKRLLMIWMTLSLLTGVMVLPAFAQNVVCYPDTAHLSVLNPDGTIAVQYLGGGSGPLYGYSIQFSWDADIAITTPAQVIEGNLLSDQGATWFEVHSSGTNSITVDCVLLGEQPGVSGPGTLFSINWDSATSWFPRHTPVGLSVESVRDSANNSLTGFVASDGWLIVLVAGVTGVAEGSEETRTWEIGDPCPNPARGETCLRMVRPSTDRNSSSRLGVFDIAGRLVKVVEKSIPVGYSEIVWDGRDSHGMEVPAGVYFFRLETGSDIISRKVILVR